MRTEQEGFWRGDFGDDYTDRNTGEDLGANISFMAKIISRTDAIKSVYEIGTSIGNNLDAIRTLAPHIKASGCEINKKAAGICRSKGHDATNSSVFDLSNIGQFDLLFTRGALIDIALQKLHQLYGLSENTHLDMFLSTNIPRRGL